MIPLLSIGLPVYNGENFLAEALDSILGQTFSDFELVISDNASTDSTETIIQNYQRCDKRIRYFRNSHNLGSGPNYRRTFELSQPTRYFKWMAHDDLHAPEFLEKCIAVLERNPDVVICHSRVVSIDERGATVKSWRPRPRLHTASPIERLRDVTSTQATFVVWGVMRRDALARTPLLGDLPEHDRPLLAEMAMMGRLHEVDEVLFYDREHPDRSVRKFDPTAPHDAAVWFDSRRRKGMQFPVWRLGIAHLAAIRRAPLQASERLASLGVMAGWAYRHRDRLARDLGLAASSLPGLGGAVAAQLCRRKNRRWQREVARAVREFGSVVRPGSRVLLIDENALDAENFQAYRTSPVPECGGKYFGLPASDREAIEAIERGVASGARYVALFWPAFWWRDHYCDFADHLERYFDVRLSTPRLVLYEIQCGDCRSGS